MRVVLDMASGENLTENTGYVFEQKNGMPRHEAPMTLQAPQARLEMVEISEPGTRTSLAGRDIQALIRFLED